MFFSPVGVEGREPVENSQETLTDDGAGSDELFLQVI